MDETSQKIIDAAMTLVRDKGYVATTTKEIARIAGVNECTLFRKFESKKEFAVNAKIIHIDVDAASISRNIDVDVPIVADAKKAICALLEKAKPLHISEWTDEIGRWKKEHPITMGEVGLTPQMIIQSLNEMFKDAIVAIDVG